MINQLIELTKNYGAEVLFYFPFLLCFSLTRCPPRPPRPLPPPQDQQVDTALTLFFHEILWEIFVFAKNGKLELAGNKIRELQQLQESYGSQAMKDYLSFHVHRMKCFVYCWFVSRSPFLHPPDLVLVYM